MKQVRQTLRRSRARALRSCMAVAVTAPLAACSSSPPSTSSSDSSIVAFIARAIKANLWGDNSFFGALAFALAILILGFIAFVDKQNRSGRSGQQGVKIYKAAVNASLEGQRIASEVQIAALKQGRIMGCEMLSGAWPERLVVLETAGHGSFVRPAELCLSVFGRFVTGRR